MNGYINDLMNAKDTRHSPHPWRHFLTLRSPILRPNVECLMPELLVTNEAGNKEPQTKKPQIGRKPVYHAAAMALGALLKCRQRFYICRIVVMGNTFLINTCGIGVSGSSCSLHSHSRY